MGIEVEKIETALDMSQMISSLDVPIGEDEETSVGDLIADPHLENPLKKLTEECNKEIIEAEEVIGFVKDNDGNWQQTRRATIHYAKDGTHIVPA